jgi:hypothetical protein
MPIGSFLGIVCPVAIWLLGAVFLGVKSAIELPDRTAWIVPDQNPKKTLLRPSALQDTSHSTLLRAAAHSPTSSPEELLRASDEQEE